MDRVEQQSQQMMDRVEQKMDQMEQRMDQKMDQQSHEVKRFLQPPPLSQTPHTCAAERRKWAKVQKFEGYEGEETLDSGMQKELKQHRKDSHKLNLVIEKVLKLILPRHVVLVNCEKFVWQEGIGSPDFFAACCFIPKDVCNPESENYGIPALLDSVTALFDGKSAGHAAEDQMYRHLCRTVASYGLLYDAEKFQLMIVQGAKDTAKRLDEIWTGSWNQPGVVKFLSEQCERYQPAEELLLRLCLAKCEAIVLGYLGKGRFGRVLKVRCGSKHFAMKVVVDGDTLEKEVERLKNATTTKKNLPVVVPAGAVHRIEGEVVRGAYFLMTQVGEPMTLEHCRKHKQAIPKICEALHACHNAGLVHGDARIQNVIKVKSRYLWVDFASTPDATKAGMKEDILTLCSSLGVADDPRANAPSTSLTDPNFHTWVFQHIWEPAASAKPSKRARRL